MIRSAYDLEWEARMWRGARDAELRAQRALLDAFRPIAEVGRKLGAAFEQVADQLGQVASQYGEALGRIAQKLGAEL